MPKPTILYVHSGGSWVAGSERVILHFIEGLRQKGWQAVVLANQRAFRNACQDCGADAMAFEQHNLLLPAEHPSLNIAAFVSAVRTIAQTAKDQRAALIHATNLHAAQASYFAARSLGVPVICHVQGTFGRASRAFCLARRLDRVVCVSRRIADGFSKRTKTEVLYNGVILPDTNAQETRNEAGRGVKVGMTAYLRPEKNALGFLELAALARRMGAEAEFLLTGSGPQEQMLKQRAKQMRLNGYLRMLGHSAEVHRFLSSLDIYVQTSRADAFPLTVPEAMAAGVPAVVTDVGGMPEAVQDGVTGYVVPPGDVESMWCKVKLLIENEDLRKRMGAAGRRRILEHFTLDKQIGRMLAIYRELLPLG